MTRHTVICILPVVGNRIADGSKSQGRFIRGRGEHPSEPSESQPDYALASRCNPYE